MTSSLEGFPTKAKEAPSPNEVRLALLDTNTVFQCLGEFFNLNLIFGYKLVILNYFFFVHSEIKLMYLKLLIFTLNIEMTISKFCK